MDLLIALILLAVFILIGWAGIAANIILPNKADKQDVQEELDKLKLQIKYLETREDGELLAYRLARAMGYEDADAASHAHYGNDCKIRIGFRVDPFTSTFTLTPVPEAMTMEQAQAKLNELLAKKHEDCWTLNKEEEELIREKRDKEFNEYWVQVTPRSRRTSRNQTNKEKK